MFRSKNAHPQQRAARGPVRTHFAQGLAREENSSDYSMGISGATSSIVRETLASPGEPLDLATRRFMEPRFGHDFSRVRVHADSRAAQSARALGAQAYMAGSHVIFGRGLYTPDTSAGRQLLAHELTHVVQQSAQGGALGGHGSVEAEADSNGARVARGEHVRVAVGAPVGIAMKPDEDRVANHSYWFEENPPQASVGTGDEITTPKRQVVLDPTFFLVPTSHLGTFKVQFAGTGSDFQEGKATDAFLAAENSVLDAIRLAIAHLDDPLADPANASSRAAARAQVGENLAARAKLKDAVQTLDGKTLNVFIANDLTVAEMIGATKLALRTQQIFVHPEDVGDSNKLEAGIRIPLIALLGGVKGIGPGPDGKIVESRQPAFETEEAKEALLHEILHVALIESHASAVQIWELSQPGLVTGPKEAKALVEDVLFRYLRAQEEIFVYTTIASVYPAFAKGKEHYVTYVEQVGALLSDLGIQLAKPKTIPIFERQEVGKGKSKKRASWSIHYILPKAFRADAKQMREFKVLQEVDNKGL
jgi:hypothetical protein